MSQLPDITLVAPLGPTLASVLLFTTFAVHLGFVLLLLGTAILATSYFVRQYGLRRCEGGEPGEWGRKALRPFIAFKSLAIVFGVGPILVMQTRHSITFLNAVNLLGGYWVLLIFLLIAGLLGFELIAHEKYESPRLQLRLTIAGLVFLLAVPAIFSGVLVLTENPGTWPAALTSLFLPGPLLFHWIMRYLHVLGAAVLVSAAFHFFTSARGNPERRAALRQWMFGGTLFQVVIGTALYASLPQPLTFLANALLVLGVLLTVAIIWVLYRTAQSRRELPIGAIGVMILALFFAMLGVRQSLQDAALSSFEKTAALKAERYADQLRPFQEEAVARYHATLDAPRVGPAEIYLKSCAFCHGAVGNGKGQDAGLLTTPPADLTAIRTTRKELLRILRDGVPGTAMPRFTYYPENQREGLVTFLGTEVGMLSPPGQLPANSRPVAPDRARTLYESKCASCHGPDGTPDAAGRRALQPPPPDFKRFTLEPRRAFEIITAGYPGTKMPPHPELSAEERWGLVKLLQGFFVPEETPP